MPSTDELSWSSAADLAAAIRARRRSPVEVTEAVLTRIEADATVLRAAAAFEAARPWTARRPSLT